jgi:hypothetical protein
VGNLRRNGFDMHGASVSSWFWRATWARMRCRVVALSCVRRPRHKRIAPAPPMGSRHIARNFRLGDQHSKSTTYPACTFVIVSHFLALVVALFSANMASDTLIPDTRVLAIASHVRFTCGGRGFQLTCYRSSMGESHAIAIRAIH